MIIVHVSNIDHCTMGSRQSSIVSYFSSTAESSRHTDPVDIDTSSESPASCGSASEWEDAVGISEKQSP